jgi:branched-chain amino acid transport system substrate-binding protein
VKKMRLPRRPFNRRARVFLLALSLSALLAAAPDSVSDAMMLLADALGRAGTTDGPKLRDAIAETRNFPGVTGPITINAERDAVKPAVVMRLLDGKFLYRETIYPDD